MAKVDTKEKLDEFVCRNWNDINKFIDEMGKDLPVPIYNSVDIRESTHKYASVDNNIYPAGFNNLCQLDLNETGNNFENYFKNNNLKIKNLGIIVESNTKNTFYLDHLVYLGRSLEILDINITYLSFDDEIFNGKEKIDLISYSKFDISFHKAKIQDGKVITADCEFDFIIMNNDQSKPIDLDWDKVTTPIHPTPKIGWYKRQKNNHFCHYNEVLKEFGEKFDLDPNLLQARFKKAENIDFASKEGIELLANEVDALLSELAPGTKIFVKASQGTYGMGIQVVSSGDEIRNMNRKKRNKMDIGKNNIKFTTALVQEGVDTVLKYDEGPAEVTIYLVNGKSVGGFMRTNPLRDAQSNLNSKGMVFRKFCISEIKQDQDHKMKEAVYSVIARLSSIASAREIAAVS